MVLGLSGLIVIGTIVLLVKHVETRLVLFGAGMLLALLAGEPFGAFTAFSAAMKQTKLFENIIAAMGFAMVMKVTSCDKHLVNLLGRWLKNAGPLLIPTTVLVTYFINISITSSSGCSAAVGPIFIPLLMAAGISPAVAAAAVLAGTAGGAMLNPGHAQILVAAEVTGRTPIEIVANHWLPLFISAGLCAAVGLYIVARCFSEHKNYKMPADQAILDPSQFKVNIVWAAVPLVPLIILMLGSTKIVPAFAPIGISHAMIIGAICSMLVTRMSPAKISKEFWHGAGEGFGHIFGIIICALIFVSGLKSVGIIAASTQMMMENPTIAKISSAFGPFILAVLSGSGDAAAIAFNQSITAHAESFGISGPNMASMAVIAGNLGRTMSPVAGSCIICAGIANVSPLDVAKRNVLGMVIGVTVSLVILLYMRG